MSQLQNKKLHIAVVRQQYTPHGGAERFVQTLLNTLNTHTEIQITLITRKWREPDNRGVTIIECNPFYLGRLWRDWSFYRAACAILEREKFDLVQSHERILCADIYRAGDGVHREWLYQRQRIRPWWEKIWTAFSPYHQYILRQEKRNYENEKLLTIIANSETTKQEIVRNFPSRKAVLTVIANAVDQERFHPGLRDQFRTSIRKQYGIAERAYLSLFIGSGYERKGVTKLIEVFSLLSDAHHLLVVGKDRHQEKFVSLSKKMGVNTRVHFLGPQQDVRPFLGAADIFVFPSLYDPLPNSTLEAAASGLPVVASSTTGAADLTEAIGIPAPDPLDTTAWKGAIETLYSRQQTPTIDMIPYEGNTMSKALIQLYQDTLERKHATL